MGEDDAEERVELEGEDTFAGRLSRRFTSSLGGSRGSESVENGTEELPPPPLAVMGRRGLRGLGGS